MSDYSHIYAVSALILLPLAIVVLVLGLWRVYTEVERDEREFMDPLPFRLRTIRHRVPTPAHKMHLNLCVEK